MTDSCTTCRAIIEALIQTGALGSKKSSVQNALLSTVLDDVRTLPKFDDARLQSLVNLKRAYLVEMPPRSKQENARERDPATAEKKKYIALGIQMAIDHLSKATGAKVDDPLPPKTRKTRERTVPAIFEMEPGKDISTTKVLAAMTAGAVSAAYRNGREDGASGLTLCAREMLRAVVARHPQTTTALEAAILSGYKLKSSTVRDAMSALRTSGMMTGSKSIPLQPTAEGITFIAATSAPGDPSPSGAELQEKWKAKMDLKARAIFTALCDAAQDGQALSAIELAERSGYDVKSSSFRDGKSWLRARGLVDRKMLVPHSIFFSKKKRKSS